MSSLADGLPDNLELSLIAPCYNEEQTIGAFFRAVTAELDGLGVSWEIICVNDGSRDRTLQCLVAEAQRDSRVRVVDFARNFGKEAALSAGLELARGRAVVPIDVDLQDPPEMIGAMLAKWREGYDVIYATRAARNSDGLIKKMSAACFYRLYNLLTDATIPSNAGDFRLMDRRVVDVVNSLQERNRFMKGLLSWPGFRQAEVTYRRPSRSSGESKFNYWRLWNFALDGITSFSTVPLRIWTYVGGIVSLFAFLYAGFLVLRTLALGIDVPGYASLMVVILFLGGVQLISLGVIGEYLGRTYEEVKRRPLYVVRRTYNCGEDAEPHARPCEPRRRPAPRG
jgi:polyisoprenyl-phosphate glycosyltransferase